MRWFVGEEAISVCDTGRTRSAENNSGVKKRWSTRNGKAPCALLREGIPI
jgi:hypothetical protein